MSQHKTNKLQKVKQQRSIYDLGREKHIHQPSNEEQEDKRVAIEPAATKLCSRGKSYFYAYSGRKPQLLVHMETHLNKELQSLHIHEPNFQQRKLQIYRDVFALFIKEFKTYQPLLSDIKREYETTIAYQQNKIQELEPLQSHLRLVTEECDHKIHARWAQEHAEMAAIKMDKEQLQRELEALKETQKATHAVVEHLQSELSEQYLLYREERDARKLLIRQLNDLKGLSLTDEHTGEEKMGRSGSVFCKAVDENVHQEDQCSTVTRTDKEMSPRVHTDGPKESNGTLAESWDVMPPCDPATLEKTVLQTLQSDYNQLKSEYDALLALHHSRSTKTTGHEVKIIQSASEYSDREVTEKSEQGKEEHNSKFTRQQQ